MSQCLEISVVVRYGSFSVPLEAYEEIKDEDITEEKPKDDMKEDLKDSIEENTLGKNQLLQCNRHKCAPNFDSSVKEFKFSRAKGLVTPYLRPFAPQHAALICFGFFVRLTVSQSTELRIFY